MTMMTTMMMMMTTVLVPPYSYCGNNNTTRLLTAYLLPQPQPIHNQSKITPQSSNNRTQHTTHVVLTATVYIHAFYNPVPAHPPPQPPLTTTVVLSCMCLYGTLVVVPQSNPIHPIDRPFYGSKQGTAIATNHQPHKQQ